jgi:hypothetical protein
MAASIISGDPMAGLRAAPQETTIANLCAEIGDFEELAGQISSLKADALQKEAEVLKAILERVAPLVPILSKKYEAFYRPVLVILTLRDEVPLPRQEGAYFFSEHRLNFYEDKSLVRTHRFGQWTGGPLPGWQLEEEDGLDPAGAVSVFGLPAIVVGLMKIFQEARETTILKSEMEERLSALTNVLKALQ